MQSFLCAGRPLLLGVGIPGGYLLDLEEKVAQEVAKGKVYQVGHKNLVSIDE
jgi:hypothetical protein